MVLLQARIRGCEGQSRRSALRHTARVCLRASRLRVPVSLRVRTLSQRTVLNNAGQPTRPTLSLQECGVATFSIGSRRSAGRSTTSSLCSCAIPCRRFFRRRERAAHEEQSRVLAWIGTDSESSNRALSRTQAAHGIAGRAESCCSVGYGWGRLLHRLRKVNWE
jgi:hypothetical protein